MAKIIAPYQDKELHALTFDAHLNASAHGEVAGSFLLGLVQSFYNLYSLPQGGMVLDITQIDPEKWYPHSLLIDTLHNIEKTFSSSESLLFRAGIHFLRIWYEHGPGKTMIHSSMDWLHANDQSGGYNSVVRGGNKNEIGWCLLHSIDETAGIAVYENVMPLPMEFVKGVFYGGCLIFDDMEYVSVDGRNETYVENSTFNKFYITVRFRQKPIGIDAHLYERINAFQLGSRLPLSPDETESVLWRYKWLQYQSALDAKYFNDINAILAQATSEGQRITRELEQASREITKLSQTDKLTQLHNRMKLDDVLAEAIVLAKRYQYPFSVILLDIDHFKQVNDTYGHVVGDQVLVQVARVLLQNTREADTLGRWGGEEFLIILPHTDVVPACALAEKLRLAIKDIAIPIVGHKTCSFGVTSFCNSDSADSLLVRADNALYQAKKLGRNRAQASETPY